MKIGVITSGISQDFETACHVMNMTDVEYADIQYVWKKEICQLTDKEVDRLKSLAKNYNIKFGCMAQRTFSGLDIITTQVGDKIYNENMDKLKRTIEIGKELGTNKISTMAFAKKQVIFGHHGADFSETEGNKHWDMLLRLFEPIIQLAEDEKIRLVVENGFSTMISTAYLARKLIDDLDTNALKVLWDPCSALYGGELAYPDGYEMIHDHIGHIYIRDAKICIPQARVDFRPIGYGDMATHLMDIAKRLREDDYKGVIALENSYRPDGGDFVDGYYQDIVTLKKIFDSENIA